MRRLVASALVSLTATAIAVALLAPPAAASPIGDAEAAMMAAWEKAGGDGSPLGPRKGDVYPAGDGFALDFDGGKMFFTPATGAKFVYGPILDKYEMLGGPAGSDLGFPAINEVPGLAGPDSRVCTFSASDKPVIFWTPDHGAFVVRGAINAAWDKLGSSGGVLGVPVGDETYNGEVSAQKFSGGQVSWNRQTKQFSTEPPALADQLKGLQVAIDPTAAINMAWRAAGGPNGPLGVKKGAQYPIGGDGIVQDFANGKVYFSPATGANAVESNILAKYESLGGPAGSDLGFPTATEADGGIPSSRVVPFSGADKPVIFWTSERGAFVVRGAMKAAWDKLRGPTGKLGAPVADQAVDGDVVSQQFAGGKISWNRAKNTFSTDPANLAPLLSGLQVSGQNQPSNSAMPAHAKGFTWQWWWLLAAIPVLVLIVLAVLVAFGWRRRRAGREGAVYEPHRDLDVGYDAAGDQHWGHDDVISEHFARPPEAPDAQAAGRVSWRRGGADEGPFGVEEEDPDAVDTDSFSVVSPAALSEAGYPETEAGYPETDYAESDYAEADFVEAEYVDVEHEAAYPEADHADDDYVEAEYLDVAVPHTPPDAEFDGGAPEAAAPEAEYPDVAIPHVSADVAEEEAAAPEGVEPEAAAAAAVASEQRGGRHAAVDDEDGGAGAGEPGRPTIHLPLDDPYQVPDGYPIKASARSGLYYTPGSELYHDTLAEIWLSSEEVAQANGFVKAD
ncbi:LGFP repeat-containing protein [Mycobacterium nebraskense]|uniref:LGFP repeat-containing protein n=1 Tax=Mycobacterium nebraskense TaxID=244292 RepID=UPI0006181F1E|nr:LGFP repeat-containing protein [Mycobacterium nebraskense]KKC03710.1 membrane protein [Mycobacterium nebraskense]